MTLVELELKKLIHQNALLRKKLEIYTWKDIKEFPAPSGCSLLLYMNTGIMIQGHANVPGITHWMRKPPSPNKQAGELK